MLQDLRFGVRMLLKQPGFSLIAVLTLALGIGATSAVFSLIQGVLLTPPPYRNPDRIVLLPATRTDGQDLGHLRGLSTEQWTRYQKEAKSFEAIAGYSWTFSFLITPEGSESLQGMWVTREYFRVTGLQPVLGRTFTDAETTGKAASVVILGYDLWQRKLNGDRGVLGRTIRISRQDSPTIIGVMGPGVRFLPSPGAAQEPNYNVDAQVDYWIPAVPDPARLKQASWDAAGRLRDGVTPAQAQAELSVLAAQQGREDREYFGIQPLVQPLRAEMNRDGNRLLLPLLAASALVLLIGCGNAAALMLVRGLQRQQEYAVRSALGVGRSGLFRQVLTECLLIALTGGLLGVAIAFGVVKVFKVIAVHAIPRLDAVSAGWPVLVCGFASAVIAAMAAGLFPALRASRLDPISILKNAGPKSSAGRGERQILRGVTMVQTALTLSLLVGAGLLIRTMINLAHVQSGYAMSRILTMSVTATQGDWLSFHRRALEKVSALPGVQYAAFAWGVPLTGNNWPGTLEIEGQPPAPKPADRAQIPLRAVTEDYFKLLGLPVLDGREFRATDDRKAPSVGIANRAFVERYFPHGSAVGKKVWGRGRENPATEIVGVVANARMDDLTHAAEPEIYLPLWQANAYSKHLVVRTASDPRAAIAAVRGALHSVDPTAGVENPKTMDEIRDDSLASRTFAMQLLVGFAVVGSVLTLVGIYGVLSLSVASRRRELAIRSAVGAGVGDIRGLVFGEGFRLIAGGVVVGLVGSLLLSRVLRSYLYGVEPADPLTLIGVGVLFAVVALLACWAPARRATRVEPLEALRYD